MSMHLKSFGSFVLGAALVGALLLPMVGNHSGSAYAHTQAVPAEQAELADQIVDKLREIDLLNRIVPLLLTKPQLEKLLGAIEKARLQVKKTRQLEFEELKKLDPKVSAVLDKALNDGTAPGMAPVHEFGSVVRSLQMTRDVVAKDNEDLVYDALWNSLDKGQKKAMVGTVNPKDIDPTLKVEDLKDEQVVRLVIRDTLLDARAYPILVRLLKLASK